MNVMLVDDDRNCRESLSSALRLNGFVVQCFDCPAQALQAYQPQSVDVIITDYGLPGMTGIDLLKEIHHKKISAPVIIISGETKKRIGNLSLKAGASAFFAKPLNIRQVIAKIKKLAAPAL